MVMHRSMRQPNEVKPQKRLVLEIHFELTELRIGIVEYIISTHSLKFQLLNNNSYQSRRGRSARNDALVIMMLAAGVI